MSHITCVPGKLAAYEVGLLLGPLVLPPKPATARKQHK